MEKNNEQFLAFARKLEQNGELGYKEFTTKQLILDYLKQFDLRVDREGFETAFSVTIGDGHPHIGLLCELDALPTLGHKYARGEDNAAHACGHSSQCAIMCRVLSELKDCDFEGRVTLFFCPGEEYTDIAYREKLISEGKIKYIGGKINMLEAGWFDDCDIIYHLHAMGQGAYKFSVNSDLAGFIYKKFNFRGRAAHAAVAPYMGINALNEYSLFSCAIGMLRESFRDEDHVRIHGFVSNGGQTVNSIPEEVVYECYVRAMNSDGLIEVAKRVDNAAKHCAEAFGGEVIIDSRPGYLPLKQNRKISSVIKEEMLRLVSFEEIEDNNPSMAAGDVGDISIFKPVVQIGYSGFAGVPHGKDFCVLDEKQVYDDTYLVVKNSVLSLLNSPKLIEEIASEYQPKMTREDYLAFINQ